MKELILYGAGGHCFAVIDLIKSINEYSPKVVYDDEPKTNEILSVLVKKYKNQEILGKSICISIGANKHRKKIAERLSGVFPSFIHKSSHIYTSSKIGIGTVVLPNSTIGSDVKVGKFCIVNNNATISHNSRISDYVHLAINVAIAGGVTIGEGTLVGAGSIILPELTVGKWVTIGAGTVVTKDIPNNAVVYGNPAKIIKYNNSK